MPSPEPRETEKEYMNRCIPYMIKEEGYPQKQSVAICYSKYRKEGTEEASPKPEKKNNNSNYHRKVLSPRSKAVILLSHY